MFNMGRSLEDNVADIINQVIGNGPEEEMELFKKLLLMLLEPE